MLAAETDNGVTLLAAEGKEIPLLRSDLEMLASSSKSLMPEGLEKDLQPQDLADLFVLIANSALSRKTFARNRPEVVQPEALRNEFYLLPENAEIYGNTLVLEDRYDNLGFWQSDNDYAAWTIAVPKQVGHVSTSGLEYACSDDAAGNEFTLYVGPSEEERPGRGHGKLGQLSAAMAIERVPLEAGQHRVLVKASRQAEWPVVRSQEHSPAAGLEITAAGTRCGRVPESLFRQKPAISILDEEYEPPRHERTPR